MLIEKIFEQARSTPLKTAYIHNGLACSYAGFARRVADAHDELARLALPAGSVAVLCVDHLAQAWALGLALRRLGLVTVSVDSAEQIGALGLANVGCVVTVGTPQDTDLATPAAAAPWRRVVARAAGVSDAPAGPVPELPAAVHAEAGHILLTSGTTGEQKKVLRDAHAEAGTLDLHARINDITPDSMVYVRDFPLSTAGGYRWPLMTWSQGATVVFQQGHDFDRPYRLPGLSHAFATPATLGFLLHAAAADWRRNDGLRLFVTGGAMTRAMATAARQLLTRQVYTVLASTEALTLGVTPLEDLDDLPWHRIHPLREVQVVDDAGRALPAGRIGLVRARVLDGLAGYVGDEAASLKFFRDAYFYSGDLGTFGPDGRLRLSGRVTDVINVMGHKVAPEPIERDLQERLAADAVCVLSLPGPDGCDDVHVVIESRRDIAHAELERLAQGPLRQFGRLHFRVVAALPRNAMGKVQRLVVRQLLQDGGGR